ncbi:rod shape-determining protein MreC [Dermacoccaceae bacterium W4C1]
MAGALAVSVLAWGLDSLAPEATSGVHDALADGLSPLAGALTVRESDSTRQLRQQRDAAREQVRRLSESPGLRTELDALLGSGTTAGDTVVVARVIGFTPPVATADKVVVTVDVGSRDGVALNRTVVSAAGLVGRTVRVGTRSSDVEVITSPGSVVGVRDDRSATLGSVSATAPATLPRRAAGLLTLTLLDQGDLRAGDRLSTLGSVGGRPYVARVPVGTVVSVDPDRGQLARTAVVRPAVTVDELQLVAVVLGTDAAQARPQVTGTSPAPTPSTPAASSGAAASGSSAPSTSAGSSAPASGSSPSSTPTPASSATSGATSSGGQR